MIVTKTLLIALMINGDWRLHCSEADLNTNLRLSRGSLGSLNDRVS